MTKSIKYSIANKKRWSNSKYREKMKKALKNHNLGKHWKLSTKSKQRQSIAQKLAWKTGVNIGNTGQHFVMKEETKKKISEKQIYSHRENPLSYRHSKKTRQKISLSNIKAWKKPELKIKVRLGQQRHRQAVIDEMKNLQDSGFNVFDSDRFHPDIIAKKDGKVYAVEVEFSQPNFSKYLDNVVFDDIYWIKKDKIAGNKYGR